MVLALTHQHQGLLRQQMGERVWVLPSLSPIGLLQAAQWHSMPWGAWRWPFPKLIPLSLFCKYVIDSKTRFYILPLQTDPSFAGSPVVEPVDRAGRIIEGLPGQEGLVPIPALLQSAGFKTVLQKMLLAISLGSKFWKLLMVIASIHNDNKHF